MHNDFRAVLALTHEDVVNARAVFGRVFNEKDALSARGFNKAPGGDAVDVFFLLKGFGRAFNLAFGPGGERNGENPHNENHWKRKAQHRADPGKKAQARGAEPHHHFAVLPASHEHHQYGHKKRQGHQRREIYQA